MSTPSIPLVILGGGDRRAGRLPEEGSDLHVLRGPKGIQVEIGGRPLIDLLIERLEASELFAPIYIAGPADLYGDRRGAVEIIDTNGSFGENIEAAVTAVRQSFPEGPVAITTCDILPEVEELKQMFEDYKAHQPLDFWFPEILAPEDEGNLGASSWKPRYRIAFQPGEEPKSVLPGHLVVADPSVFRLPLVYRTFQLAYQSRNQPIIYRLWMIVRHVMGGLVLGDLRLLFKGRLPSLTWSVIGNGVALAYHLRDGVIDQAELEDRLHRIFVRYDHRKRHPERRGRLPLLRGLSLAKDIDTEEEVAERERTLHLVDTRAAGSTEPADS